LKICQIVKTHLHITATSRDPCRITTAIEVKLCRKNRLVLAGRTEEASAVAQKIGKDIARRNKTHLSHMNPRADVKDLWAAVRQLTGWKRSWKVAEGITAESLNQHYARISTDPCYQPPKRKITTVSLCYHKNTRTKTHA